MRHWISERAGRVTASIAARPPSAGNGLRLSLFAAPIRGLAVATALLIAAAPVRAWADPCPPPKDGIFGGPFCPQAFLNSSNSQTRTKHAAIRHKDVESAAEGAGNSTCAEFNKESADNSTAEDTYFVWAEGYMTGLDLVELSDSGQSRNFSSESESEQEHTVHRFCAEHPEQPYFVAVIALFRKLPKNAPIKASHNRVFE